MKKFLCVSSIKYKYIQVWLKILLSQLENPNKVFLAADDDTIKSNLKSAMVKNGLDVITIPDSISHIAHSKDDEKILRTFAEFHIISHCKRHILTTNSLFGVTASIGCKFSMSENVISGLKKLFPV